MCNREHRGPAFHGRRDLHSVVLEEMRAVRSQLRGVVPRVDDIAEDAAGCAKPIAGCFRPAADHTNGDGHVFGR